MPLAGLEVRSEHRSPELQGWGVRRVGAAGATRVAHARGTGVLGVCGGGGRVKDSGFEIRSEHCRELTNERMQMCGHAARSDRRYMQRQPAPCACAMRAECSRHRAVSTIITIALGRCTIGRVSPLAMRLR